MKNMKMSHEEKFFGSENLDETQGELATDNTKNTVFRCGLTLRLTLK